MGNVMAGLGLVLLGIILFQVAETFFRYPAEGKVNTSPKYLVLKMTSFFLIGLGAVFVVSGFM
jgi:hypothetical protein